MKRRYLILAVCFSAFVGIVLGVLAMLPPRPGVTKGNFDRIEKGMTAEDAARIFGRPADFEIGLPQRVGCYLWFRNDGANACISMDMWGRVGERDWTDSTETILNKLRRWLHLD